MVFLEVILGKVRGGIVSGAHVVPGTVLGDVSCLSAHGTETGSSQPLATWQLVPDPSATGAGY